MKFIKNIFKKKETPRSQEDGVFFSYLTNILGITPLDLTKYKNAFTHRSCNLKDDLGNTISYERLEFLGDAMLSAVIATHLYNEAPAENEGYLTKMRSKIVSRQHLNELGKDLNLVQHLKSKLKPKQFGVNIHGNLLEALIGAIYLDLGYQHCENFIQKKVINPYVDIIRLEGKITSYKSLIIEWCQKEKKQFAFEEFEDNSLAKDKLFGIKLVINNKVIAKARATSKKKAEEKAAQRTYFAFQNKI